MPGARSWRSCSRLDLLHRLRRERTTSNGNDRQPAVMHSGSQHSGRGRPLRLLANGGSPTKPEAGAAYQSQEKDDRRHNVLHGLITKSKVVVQVPTVPPSRFNRLHRAAFNFMAGVEFRPSERGPAKDPSQSRALSADRRRNRNGSSTVLLRNGFRTRKRWADGTSSWCFRLRRLDFLRW